MPASVKSKSKKKKTSKPKLSIEKQVQEVQNQIDDINFNVNLLKTHLLEKTPEHFSALNVINAFFGALLIGLTFVMKGAMVRISQNINLHHIIAMIAFTLSVMLIQIYYIGYARVKYKDERLFGQFVVKRLLSMAIVSLSVSVILIYLCGINLQVANSYETAKAIVVLWMACAIGSTIPGLLIKY